MRRLSAAAQIWIVAVLFGGAAAIGVGLVQTSQPAVSAQLAEPAVWLLLVGACVAHALPVVSPRHQAYHATQAFLMASVLVLAWPYVVLIVVAAHIAEWLRRPRPVYIQAYNVGCYLLAAAAAYALLDVLDAHPFSPADTRALTIGLLAAAAMLLLNHGLTAIVLWLARNISPTDSGLFGLESLGLDGLLLVVGIAIGGGLQLQPWSIVVTASPLVLIYRALRVANVESTSHRDQLSGLYNARHLSEAIDLEVRRAGSEAHATGLVVAALDDVPGIVRRHGRATLDFLAVAMADRLRRALRGFDIVARLDEGSLAVLLPGVQSAELSAMVRRLGDMVAAEPFGLATTRDPVPVSMSEAYALVAAGATPDGAELVARLHQAAARVAVAAHGSIVEVDVSSIGDARMAAAPAAVSVGRVAEPLPALSVIPRSWLIVGRVAVVVVGLAITGLVVATSTPPELPLAAGVLALVTLSELLAFELYDRSAFSVSFAPIVAAGLLGGPAATLLATWSVAIVRGLVRRTRWNRVLFNACAFTLTGVPAMIVATGGGRLAVQTNQLVLLGVGTAIASSIYYLHTFVVAGAIAVDLGADPRQVWSRNYRWLFPHYVLLGWMGLGLALATVELGPLGTALFVAPPLAMRVVLKQYVDRTAGAVHHLEAANAELRAASALLRQRGEELALLSDLGQLVAAEPRPEALQARVVARCVPALGDVCAMLLPSADGLDRTIRSTEDVRPREVADKLRLQSVGEVLALAAGLDAGRAPDEEDGTWLSAALPGTDGCLGWLVGWSAGPIVDDEHSRRLTLMREVAQRVALVLERDALLEEAAELEALRTVDRVKTDFIATTAHELRTPLTSLQGYTELLRNPVDRALRDRWLSIVHVEAAQLGQVVDQLLDVSRIDSGRFSAERREFDLAEVIGDLVRHFGAQAAVSGHELAMDVPSQLKVFADPAQTERILRNLVSNALKYSPAGGPIRVLAEQCSPADVEVCVEDRGLGIPADWSGRLFERFQRVDRPDRASIRGIGLGLYITRQLVELNGGRIWATSDGAGQGATFHFTLPAVPIERV